MKINIPKIKSTKPIVLYTALYLNGTFMVKIKGKLIPINNEQLIINNKTKFVYALPNNNKQKAWHKKRFKLLPTGKPEIISIYWSVIYDGQQLRGYVKENQFYFI